MQSIIFTLVILLTIFLSSITCAKVIRANVNEGEFSTHEIIKDQNPYFYCGAGQNTSIVRDNKTNVVFSIPLGCNGYDNNARVNWTYSSIYDSILKFEYINTEQNYDYVTITIGGVTSPPYSGTTIPTAVWQVPAGQQARIYFYSDQSTNLSGFRIRVISAPATSLSPNRTVSTTQVNSGDYTYFKTSPANVGSTLRLTVTLNNFRGIKGMGVFVSRSTFPDFNNFDFSNYSTSANSTQNVTITIRNPNGVYFISVFVYGTASSINVSSIWSFAVPAITNNQVVTARTNMTYQFSIPCNQGPNQTFEIRASRDVPGGYPIYYLGYGYLPSSSNYDLVLDTSVQNYFDVTFPFQCTNNVPWLVTIVASIQSGFSFQVVWGGNLNNKK